jgi:hypothetical protein
VLANPTKRARGSTSSSTRPAKRAKVLLAPCEAILTTGDNKGKACGSTSNCRHRRLAAPIEPRDPLQLTLLPYYQRERKTERGPLPEPSASQVAEVARDAKKREDERKADDDRISEERDLEAQLAAQLDAEMAEGVGVEPVDQAEPVVKEVGAEPAIVVAPVDQAEPVAEEVGAESAIVAAPVDQAEPVAEEVGVAAKEDGEVAAKEDGDDSDQSGMYEPRYCGMPCKDGRPCKFEISVNPCPVHVKSDALAERHAPEPEYCNKLRKDGKPCQWNVSIRPCARHTRPDPTAEELAELADRLAERHAMPTCPMVKRNGLVCGLRECGFHAPPEKRCASMLDGDPKLQCFRFKGVGEFCLSHEALPNLSVNMVDMLQLTPGNDITMEGFLAKYYPDADEPCVFNFPAYVRSMREQVF